MLKSKAQQLYPDVRPQAVSGRWASYRAPDSRSYQRLYSPKAITLNDFTLSKIPDRNRQSSVGKGRSPIHRFRLRAFGYCKGSIADMCDIYGHILAKL